MGTFDLELERERLRVQAKVAAAAERSRVTRETRKHRDAQRGPGSLTPQAVVELALRVPGEAAVVRRIAVPEFARPWVAQRFETFLEDLREDCRGTPL